MDMDEFERRREERRKKREEMRREVERMTSQRTDDDEEELAKERRRKARQERLRESAFNQDSQEFNSQHSAMEEETKVSRAQNITDDDDEMAERLQKREERRQKRLQEAMERQSSFDPTIRETRDISKEIRRHEREEEEEEEESNQRNEWRRELETEIELEVEPEPEPEPEPEEEPEEEKEEIVEEKFEKPYQVEKKSQVWKGELVEHTEKKISKIGPENGEALHEEITQKHKKMERVSSYTDSKSVPEAEEAAAKLEAERKLEELRRRQDEKESEEFEKMKQKQQEAVVELEELKKKREGRRKVREEEEQKRQQDEAERKAREEEEKRKLKEEIERRRAEAAEKRQKPEDVETANDNEPFKCLSPRGSSLKIGERADFLNKSAKKSTTTKVTRPLLGVSKIDSKLEQYTSAIEGAKTTKGGKPSASDLPLTADGVRNIKSMWETGDVYSSTSPSNKGTPNKEVAGLKVGVAGRINQWLTKTPETNKSPSSKPSTTLAQESKMDVKPGDVSSKRNLWENKTDSSNGKSASPSKITAGSKFKSGSAGDHCSYTNEMAHYENEP